MSNLTDAQEKAYAGEIKALLEQYKSEMLAADPPVDPTSRIANLTAVGKATEDAEAAQVKTAAADKAAIDLANSLRGNFYDLAQKCAGLLEGTLGKDHPAAQKARSIRGEMSNLAARGPRTEPPAK